MRKNFIILLTALIISIIFSIPHIIMLHKLGASYNPMSIAGVNALSIDETYYASNIQDVADEHYIVRNSQLKEYKERVNQFDTLPFLILGGMEYFFGSAKAVNIVADFIFPPIIFLFSFLLLRLMKVRFNLALLGGISLLILSELVSLIPPVSFYNLKEIADYFLSYQSGIRPLEFSKLYTPELTFVFLSTAMYFFYRAIYKKDTKFFILAGVFGGLLFYTYIYYSIFFAAAAAVLFAFFLMKRDFATVKKIFITALLVGLIAVPYFANMYQFNALPNHQELMLRVETEFGRGIKWLATFKYLAFLGFGYLIVKKKDLPFIFFASLLIGGMLCLNMQLVLGYNVQSWHWLKRAVDPISILFLAYLAEQYLVSNTRIPKLANEKIWNGLVAAGLIFVISFGFYTQINSALNSYKSFSISDKTIELFDWLNENTEKDSVIMAASIETNSLIPVYTHNNVYLPNAILTSIPTDEIIDRILFTYSTFGIPSSDLYNKLNQNNSVSGYFAAVKNRENVSREEFETKFFINYFFHSQYYYSESKRPLQQDAVPAGINGNYIPDNVKQKIISKYSSDNFAKYDFDYVLVGPYERHAGSMKQGFKKVFSNSEYELYVRM